MFVSRIVSVIIIILTLPLMIWIGLSNSMILGEGKLKRGAGFKDGRFQVSIQNVAELSGKNSIEKDGTVVLGYW